MSTTPASIGRHIHLDLDVDPERVFYYRSLGGDGHRVMLGRGDTVTFTCKQDFSVGSPVLRPSPHRCFMDDTSLSRHA